MTVFKCRIFYDADSMEYQERYIIAETACEALEKIEEYYNDPRLLTPCHITWPEVEIYSVIA